MNTSWITHLGTVLRLEWYGAELSSWQRWVALAVYPATYLGLLAVGLSTALGGENYLAWVLPGVIVMQALSGMNRLVARTVTERRWGLAAFKLQAGVPLSAYTLGIQAPGLVTFAFQALVVVVLAALMGVWLGIGPALLVILAGVLAALFWGCVGYAVAAVIRSYQTRDFVLALLILPLTFAAPVFYSLESAPAFLRAVAAINPLTYQVTFVRGLSEGEFLVVPGLVSGVLLVAALAAAIWTTTRLRELSFEG